MIYLKHAVIATHLFTVKIFTHPENFSNTLESVSFGIEMNIQLVYVNNHEKVKLGQCSGTYAKVTK